MAVPTDRISFKDHCLRALGDPLIQVNVSPDQIDDQVDRALYKFYERNYQAIETIFILHVITTPEPTYVVDTNGNFVLDSNGLKIPILDSAGDPVYTTNTETELDYITLDNDIIGISNVFRPSKTYGLNSIEYQVFIDDMLNYGRTLARGNISDYFINQSNLTLLNRFFSPERQYDFNVLTHRLRIAGGLDSAYAQDGAVVIRAFRKIHGEIDSNDPVGTDYHNIWKNRWLQDYSAALIRRQWAVNLGKYQQVQLLGGVTMNGDQMYQWAMDDIAKLEEDLYNTYELPIDFMLG